ncbi:MAG: nucleotidyltransferase domain-containing protein [Elusimicrobia bacterium]|nr:nucleotidyltransferase domain-containing protein [Elusimicrobiota bacterium]
MKSRKRENILKKELRRIIRVVKERYKAEKIILFGSLASRNVSSESDLDIMILKKSRKRYLDRIDEFFRIVKPEIAVDVFILTPSEARKNNPYVRKIFEEGKVVYEAQKR